MNDSMFNMLWRHRTRQRERASRSAERSGEPYRDPTHVIQYKGLPVEKVHRGFKRHTRLLGWADVTPNTLRHTFATHAARHANEVDMTLTDLMKAMGHSNIKTTMRYLKHFPGRHRKVIQAAHKKKK
jgi:integrase